MPQENWEEHVARRLELIARRHAPTPPMTPSGDMKQRAGCFDCDLYWSGQTAHSDANEHRLGVGHDIWHIVLEDIVLEAENG